MTPGNEGWHRWKPQSFADLSQTFALLLTLVSVWALFFQLQANNRTNEVAIRGQLFEEEAGLETEEQAADDVTFATLWSVVPETVGAEQYPARLLAAVTTEPTVINAASAAELYHALFDIDVLTTEGRKAQTVKARQLFSFTGSYFYHVHTAYDYRTEGVLRQGEWETWRGLIREMHGHPILLATIWHGHQHRYFSRAYGEFIRQELCGRPDEQPDGNVARSCAVAKRFYPEMFDDDWLAGLPTY